MTTHRQECAFARGRRIVFALALMAAWLPQQGSTQTLQPGRLPGEFSVSPGGAATGQIPIQAPPGVAGMEPKLALAYSSQAGLVVAGTGWNLQGLSSIVRSTKS